MKKHIVLSAVLLILVSCGSTKLSKEEEAVRKAAIALMIEEREYSIDVSRMLPLRGRSIHLTGSYSLRIERDSAYAYLPFFGRATYAPYGGDGGIRFDEAMKDYQATPNKKGDGWDISFKINTPNLYLYQFFVSIYDNGNATINVNSAQRDAISYQGNVRCEV